MCGDECGDHRPPDVTGGSLLLPTEGEQVAGGLGVVMFFLVGLLLLWTPLSGELEHEDDCLFENPPPTLGEDGITCLARSPSRLSDCGGWGSL